MVVVPAVVVVVVPAVVVVVVPAVVVVVPAVVPAVVVVVPAVVVVVAGVVEPRLAFIADISGQAPPPQPFLESVDVPSVLMFEVGDQMVANSACYLCLLELKKKYNTFEGRL